MAMLLYEGKAKQVYQAEHDDEVIIHYKDDATAGNGAKKAVFSGKGIYNAAITAMIFQYLEDHGIKTHYLRQLDERKLLCKKVEIILLEVIGRNIATGSLVKRIGLVEGAALIPPVYELCYKKDELHDPLINNDHAMALGLANAEELALIFTEVRKINALLQNFFQRIGVTLVDFKVEFGRTSSGEIILADEISPDTCRLWDKQTKNKLDKDRFRQDLGHVMDAYQEIYTRMQKEDA